MYKLMYLLYKHFCRNKYISTNSRSALAWASANPVILEAQLDTVTSMTNTELHLVVRLRNLMVVFSSCFAALNKKNNPWDFFCLGFLILFFF